MREKFRNNLPYLSIVKSKDLASIKRELINMIFSLHGNKQEIELAIQYAEEEVCFVFDKHDNSLNNKETDKKRELAQEQILARINFSRERYFKIVDLYGQVYGMKNNKEKSSNLVSPIKVEDKVADKRLIYGAIAVVIVVSVYFILKD